MNSHKTKATLLTLGEWVELVHEARRKHGLLSCTNPFREIKSQCRQNPEDKTAFQCSVNARLNIRCHCTDNVYGYRDHILIQWGHVLCRYQFLYHVEITDSCVIFHSHLFPNGSSWPKKQILKCPKRNVLRKARNKKGKTITEKKDGQKAENQTSWVYKWRKHLLEDRQGDFSVVVS